ncbi:Hypoxia induced protein [Senna tora]|uniref:Hypoxia induced protein n=1 Tax=Senna tora TaxID=362788 RepID=A0A834U1M6_9FABA|nr:Hypoxia induced protein [Senna tora]
MSIHSWISEHKLASLGAVWASGIGASLVANSRTTSPMKPSLRLIHARMHAQALTLAVLSAAAAYQYYHTPTSAPQQPKSQAQTNIKDLLEWDIITSSPF